MVSELNRDGDAEPSGLDAAGVAELKAARKRIEELEQELARRDSAEAGLRSSEDKYRTLVESSPYCIKLIDTDGRLLSMNRAGKEMINVWEESEIVGRPYMKVVSEQDFDRVASLLMDALNGTPSEFEFMAAPGQFFRSNFVPICDADGKVNRLLSITQDVTERRRLIDDLDHRVKNNLASVLALSKRTQASAKSLSDFVRVFDSRITAMARSHEALAYSHWQGIELRDVVTLAIESSMPSSKEQVRIVGESVALPPRACSPLTLVLHELTTNAMKYGAFSSPDGSLEIDSSIDEKNVLTIRWKETTPTPNGSSELEPGVGLTLIRGFIEHELRGSVDLELASDGMIARLTIPLETHSADIDALARQERELGRAL